MNKSISFFGEMRDNKFIMKSTKLFTAVIVFIGTFALSTGLVWLFVGLPTVQTFAVNNCSGDTTYAADIESLLSVDDGNGSERSGKMYSASEDATPLLASDSFPDYAEAVADYADDSSSLDTDNLPRDFQSAWKKHMKAWRDYSNFLNKLKNNSARKKVSTKDFHQMETEFNHDINQTWYQVLSLGDKYGADVRGF